MKKGVLIAIEGIDGAGKTTQVNLLSAFLKHFSFHVEVDKEPTRKTQAGQRLVDSSVTGRLSVEEEIALFISDRQEHVDRWVRPWLENDAIVILDRYYFSNMAYQGVRGADWEALRERNEAIAPVPDITLILDLDVDLALDRISSNRKDGPNHFEDKMNLESVRDVFHKFIGPRVFEVDGSGSIGDVFSSLRRLVLDVVLLERLCAKFEYKSVCEPSYCSFGLECKYLHMCRWAPSFD